MGATPVVAEVLAVGELSPGRVALALHAPSLVAGLRPGHALHLVRAEAGGFRLRRVAPVTAVDPLSGSVEVALLPRADGGSDTLADVRAGESVALGGPIGQPIGRVPGSAHLLVACDGEGFPWVRLLISAAVAEGRDVVLLQEAQSAAEVVPAQLLPERVEMAVATGDGSLGHHGGIEGLLGDYVAWADQVVAAGSDTLLAAVAAADRARAAGDRSQRAPGRGRRPTPARRGRAPDVPRTSLLLAHEIGCGVGVCGGCSISTQSGELRLCREGPAIAAADLRAPGGA